MYHCFAVGRGTVSLNRIHSRISQGLCRSFQSSSRCLQQEGLLQGAIKRYKELKQIVTKKRVDAVPEGYQLVYRSPIENYIIYSHLIAATVSFGFACYFGYAKIVGVPIYQNEQFISGYTEVAVTLVFFVALVAIVQIVNIRSPLRMYYSEKENQFLSVFGQKWLPMATELLTIKPGQVHHLNYQSQAVPWSPALHVLRKPDNSTKKLLLFDHSFQYPVYYNKLLGTQ